MLTFVLDVEYRTLERFPHRRFGSDGSIWSKLARGGHGRLLPDWKRLKVQPNEEGYCKISLSQNGMNSQYAVHRLIAEAFHGPCPPGMECRHLDDNPFNNAATNLAWGTSQENKEDSLRNGNRRGRPRAEQALKSALRAKRLQERKEEFLAMPRLTNRLPGMKLHKSSGQAVVWHKNRCYYLGKYGSPEAKEKYERMMVDLVESRKREIPTITAGGPTIDDVLIAFLEHARDYYRSPDGDQTGEAANLIDACRPLSHLFGTTRADRFGPADLETVRASMIQSGLARSTVNSRINRIRRVFKWAVSKTMVPTSVLAALRTVDGLRAGRSKAKEARKLGPASAEAIEAALPYMQAPIAAMVKVQLLTGCRSNEVTGMRSTDLDRSGEVWEYRPAHHKTEHHGKDRVIFVGPKAQEILRPFLKYARPDAYLFRARKSSPRRYDRRTYRQAVVRACDKAFPPPAPLAGAELRDWRRKHRWSPLQLRKTRGTEIRRLFGLEASQVVLGHARADVTQVYAERDMAKAREIIREIG